MKQRILVIAANVTEVDATAIQKETNMPVQRNTTAGDDGVFIVDTAHESLVKDETWDIIIMVGDILTEMSGKSDVTVDPKRATAQIIDYINADQHEEVGGADDSEL